MRALGRASACIHCGAPASDFIDPQDHEAIAEQEFWAREARLEDQETSGAEESHPRQPADVCGCKAQGA